MSLTSLPLSSASVVSRFQRLLLLLFAIVLLTVTTCVVADEDLYRVLGLDRHASPKAIKKAFRKLTKEQHPDVNPDPNAKERYASILRAYNVLDDPKKRETYDRYGVVEGENSPQEQMMKQQRAHPFNAFFQFQQQRQRRRPIESESETLSLTSWFSKVANYRGKRIKLIQVYHDDAYECHVFGPSWENLVKNSPLLRYLVDFYRIDAMRDEYLLEISNLHPSSYPTLYAIMDGNKWSLEANQMALGAPGPHTQTAITDWVNSFYVDLWAHYSGKKAQPPLQTEPELRSLLYDERYHQTVIIISDLDPKKESAAMMFATMFSSQARVVIVSHKVFDRLQEVCTPRMQPYLALWLYNEVGKYDPCRMHRYPAYKILNFDDALSFVSKRIHRASSSSSAPSEPKILTNSTFHDVCGAPHDEGEIAGPKLCVIQVLIPTPATSGYAGYNRPQEKLALTKLFESDTAALQKVFTAAVVDGSHEPNFMKATGIDQLVASSSSSSRAATGTTNTITLVVVKKSKPTLFQVFHDTDLTKAKDFLIEMSTAMMGNKRFKQQRSPSGGNEREMDLSVIFQSDQFFISDWRMLLWNANYYYSQIPLGSLLPIIMLWGVATLFKGGGGVAGSSSSSSSSARTGGTRPQQQQQSQQGARREQHPNSHQQQQQPRPTGGASSRPSGAPPPPPPPRTAPPPSSHPSASSSSSSAAAPKKKQTHLTKLTKEDILYCLDSQTSTAQILLLVYTTPQTTAITADVHRLFLFPNITIRYISPGQKFFWHWLRTHDAELGLNVESLAIQHKECVFVAYRPKRGTAAIKPYERPLQMWVEGILDGAVVLPLKLELTARASSEEVASGNTSGGPNTPTSPGSPTEEID